MSKNKKTKNILLLVILFAIVGIAVGYAALSQYLFLNGTGTIASSSEWNVHFTTETAMVPDTTVEDDGVKNQSISIDSTLLQGTFAATLEPGASVTYTVNIVNDGTIRAVADGNPIITPGDSNTQYITCTVSPSTAPTTELYKDSGIHTYNVTLTCADMDNLPGDDESKTATIKVDFNYSQK